MGTNAIAIADTDLNMSIHPWGEKWKRYVMNWRGFASGFVVLLVVYFIVAAIVRAGPLTPSATPAATGYTLDDIYTRLTTNATSTSGDHVFTPGSAPAASLRALSEIYGAIPTIVATSVRSGTSYLGVSGTYAPDFPTLSNVCDSDTSDNVTGTLTIAPSVVLAGNTYCGVSGTYAPDFPTLSNVCNSDTSNSATGTLTIVASAVVTGNTYCGVSGTYAPDFPTLSNVCDSDSSDGATGTLSVTSSTVGVGNTYCGVAGILLKELFNGTATSSGTTGGTQASGGVEDFNSGNNPPTDRYTKSWTACTSGNNYCGTGDSGADAKDDSTGIVWSLPCTGSGCSGFADTGATTYSWDTSGANNGGKTASQLCSSHAGWSLPHEKQILQAFIDGAYGNLEAAGTAVRYWTSTVLSTVTANAWASNLTSGLTQSLVKTTANNGVRCVR